MAGFPIDKKWSGVFPGKYSGNLWQTFNIDLEKEQGRLRLGDKFRILVDGNDTDAPGIPYKFLRTNADATDRWWALTSTKMLKTAGTSPFVTYASDTSAAGSPVDPLDMETHESANGEQRLVVSRDTDLAILNLSGAANAWTASWWDTTLAQTNLTSGKLHPLARLQRLLAIGDVVTNATTPIGVIHTIDKNDTVSASRLTFPSGYEPRCIYPSSDLFWIGLQNVFGQGAMIISWDGTATSYNNEYKDILGSFPLTGWIINNIPYFIDEVGYIYKYTGGGFSVEQQFPMVEEGLVFSSTVASTNTIQVYGATKDRHLVYINVGAPTASRRMRSGIWCFNTITKNLYHVRGIGTHKTAGTDLDYGTTPLFRPGAIKYIFDGANSINDLLIGGAVYINYSSTTKTVIGRTVSNKSRATNAGRNRGYFITPWIPTSELSEYWQGLWIKFRAFVSNSNSIILKHRVRESRIDQNDNDESVTQATGNWRNDTSFVSAVPTGVVVGDEVEVMAGLNAGSLFHITTMTDTNAGAVTPNGSTNVIVSINEAVGSTNDTTGALFNFENWINDSSISDTTSSTEFLPLLGGDTDLGNNVDEIQFKLELRGFSNEIKELLPLSGAGQKIKT